MPTITRLERQKRNPERVNVYLDGEFSFGLPEIDAARLKRGQLLTEAEVVLLCNQDAISKAYEAGLRLLTTRPRSSDEIRRALQQRQIPDEVIEAALERLNQQGYVDDAAFVRFWIENRTQFKPLGVRALRYELRQKGVPNSIVDEALAELPDDEEADLAYRALLPRLRRLRGQSQREVQQQLYAFLQRRGFSPSMSREALKRLIQEVQDQDPDFFQDHDASTLSDTED